MNYKLDSNFLDKEYQFYIYALDMIKEDYEIQAIKDSGDFDIFKNIVGLNLQVCCMENAYKVLAPALKRIEPVKVGIYTKYYDNDTFGFELYSTLLTLSPNKIVKAVDFIFKDKEKNKRQEISHFIRKINLAINEAIEYAIVCVSQSNIDNIFISKYHSLYVIAGIILSQYEIDTTDLQVRKIAVNKGRMDLCIDFMRHKKEKWFIDENRQVGFFNNKMKELMAKGN